MGILNNTGVARLFGCALMLFTVLLSGCRYQDYDIVLPIKNAEFIDQLPERFLIRYDRLPDLIMLNGIPVQHLFQFADGEATSSGSALAPYLTQGHNNIAVDPMQFGPRRFFYFDNEGPRVVITQAQQDDMVTIRGVMIDPSGPYGLSVNGVAATLGQDNTFEVQLVPSTVYRFDSEDEYAQVATQHYADRALILDDIVKLDVDEATIKELIPLAQELAEEQNIAALLGSANANTLFNEGVGIELPKVVIIEEFCPLDCVRIPPIVGPEVCSPIDICIPELALGPFSVDLIRVKGTLTDLSFEELEIEDLDLKSGSGWDGLGLDATLKNTDLGVQIQSSLLSFSSDESTLLDAVGLGGLLSGLNLSFNPTIGINRLRLAADFGLQAENGDVDVSVQNISAVGLGGADSDFDLNLQLPPAIANFGWGLPGAVVGLIEAGIEGARDLIVDLLLGKLVPFIANLIIDPLINELQIRLGATVNNGALLTALVGVQDIEVINDNRMQIAMQGRIGTETTELTPGDIDLGVSLGFPDVLAIDDHLFPDLLGIPVELGAAPGLVPNALGFRFTPVDVPEPGNTENLGLVVNSNIINQALLAIYEAGILSPTVPILDELSQTGGYFITTMEQANTRIVFAPKSVPELSFRGDSISVAYLTVDLFEMSYQVRNEAEEWETSATLEFNMQAPVQLAVDGADGIQLALINPEVDVTLDLGHWIDYRLQFPQKLFFGRAISALILEQINSGLRLIQLPASLQVVYGDAGLQVMPETVQTVGKPREHFGLSASFDAL